MVVLALATKSQVFLQQSLSITPDPIKAGQFLQVSHPQHSFLLAPVAVVIMRMAAAVVAMQLDLTQSLQGKYLQSSLAKVVVQLMRFHVRESVDTQEFIHR
jgi:hypothetical protein